MIRPYESGHGRAGTEYHKLFEGWELNWSSEAEVPKAGLKVETSS